MTFTEDGSQKVKLSPTGVLPAAQSTSVNISSEQAREIVEGLQNLGEKLDRLSEQLDILLHHL